MAVVDGDYGQPVLITPMVKDCECMTDLLVQEFVCL